jgi:hypothetical protein
MCYSGAIQSERLYHNSIPLAISTTSKSYMTRDIHTVFDVVHQSRQVCKGRKLLSNSYIYNLASRNEKLYDLSQNPAKQAAKNAEKVKILQSNEMREQTNKQSQEAKRPPKLRPPL